LFLEQAISRHYRIEFTSMDSYFPKDANWSLVKLHGSVQWGREILNGNGRPGNPIALVDSLHGPLRLGELEFLNGYKGSVRARGTQFMYPALAVPVDGKDEFVCDPSHSDAAKNFLERCTDFLILGFSGLDTHVLNLLKGVSCVNSLTVVNEGNQGAIDTINRIVAVNPVFRQMPAHYPAAGFGNFIREGHFDNFLELMKTVS